jgi:hypothetical protein
VIVRVWFPLVLEALLAVVRNIYRGGICGNECSDKEEETASR